jgi:hypothetical protein
MPKVKAFLLVILFLTAACSQQKAPQTAAAVPDNEENRRAAARQYLAIVPPQEMLQELSGRMAQMMPENKRKIFLEVMGDKSLQDAMYRITEEGVVKHFTLSEIKALTAFYSSRDGNAVLHKFGPYMADILPPIKKKLIVTLQQALKNEQVKQPQAQGTR